MDGTQIYQNFTAGDSRSLQAAADVVKQLSDGYKEEAEAIKALQDRMNASWTGDSGAAAAAGPNALAQAFKDSAGPLDVTNGTMDVQSSAFEKSKATVVEVPPAPEKPNPWTTGAKAAIPFVGPALAASDVKSYQEGLAATNAANENNVRVMEQYSNVTGDTRSSLPMDYQPLALDGATVGLAPAQPGSIGSTELLYNDRTNASSTTSVAGTGSVSGGAPVSSGPNLNGPAVSTAGPSSTGAPAPAVSSGPNLPSTANPSGGGTNASTFVPSPTTTSGYNNSSTTQRPGTSSYRGTTGLPSTSNTSSRNNSAAGRLYDSENARSGRSGGGSVSGRGGASESLGRGASESVGRGGSAAGESARSLGAGKGTGAGSLNPAAAEQAAASRTAAGRSASGTPMGAAGQRGQGEEDEEHKRPDYLLEADPDAVFGTDVRATPPVIGE